MPVAETKPMEGAAEQEQPKDIVLSIALNSRGQITVNGPIVNEPLCVWMLYKARGIIEAHNFRAAQPIIQKPGGIMNFIRGHK